MIKEMYNKEYKKAMFLLGNTHTLNKVEAQKIVAFHNSFKTEKTGISVLSLIQPYYILPSSTDEERMELTEKIYNWCWDNNIPMFNTILFLTLLYIAVNTSLEKVLFEFMDDKSISEHILNYGDEKNREYIISEVSENFKKSFEDFMNKPVELKHNAELYQKIMKNTYNDIKKRVKKSIDDITLPLRQYTLDWNIVRDDIEADQDTLMGIIGNPKSFSKIKQKNHFLHHLRYDDLDFDEDENIIFRGHSNGLSRGYTQKAILLSIDKDIAIREWETKLKHLRDYETEDSKILIQITEALIVFIRQKKYVNMIQFKALAKEVGITKNQAKNYAKRLFTIGDKTFTKNFDDLKLLNK